MSLCPTPYWGNRALGKVVFLDCQLEWKVPEETLKAYVPFLLSSLPLSLGQIPFPETPLCGEWCWERLKAGGEDRGWDGWMASLTQWTWVWVNSENCWWTGTPGMLQFIGSRRVRLNWATVLNWTFKIFPLFLAFIVFTVMCLWISLQVSVD